MGLDLFHGVYRVLETYRTHLGVEAFSLALSAPPLALTGEQWEWFQAIAWLLDRASSGSSTTDFAAMEIYGQPIPSSNPFEVTRALTES